MKTVITKKGTKHNVIGEKREPLSGNTVILVDSPYDEDNEVYDRTYYGAGTWWVYLSEIAEVVN